MNDDVRKHCICFNVVIIHERGFYDFLIYDCLFVFQWNHYNMA